MSEVNRKGGKVSVSKKKKKTPIGRIAQHFRKGEGNKE